MATAASKVHAGEERTLFRRLDELFQLDHFSTDENTYRAAERCEVIHFEDLARFSDHAPLLLEIDNVLASVTSAG